MNETSTPSDNSAKTGIASNRQLAKVIGRSETAIRQWRRRADWPTGEPPWDAAAVEAIRQWASTLGTGTGDANLRDELLRQRIENVRLRNLAARLRMDRDAGVLIPLADVSAAIAAIVSRHAGLLLPAGRQAAAQVILPAGSGHLRQAVADAVHDAVMAVNAQLRGELSEALEKCRSYAAACISEAIAEGEQ